MKLIDIINEMPTTGATSDFITPGTEENRILHELENYLASIIVKDNAYVTGSMVAVQGTYISMVMNHFLWKEVKDTMTMLAKIVNI